jgi:hypothetical protein
LLFFTSPNITLAAKEVACDYEKVPYSNEFYFDCLLLMPQLDKAHLQTSNFDFCVKAPFPSLFALIKMLFN